MISALVPIWILGGAAAAVVILNIVTAGGATSGDRIDPNRMNPGVADPRLSAHRPVNSPLL
jgi:hypothetical protein